MSNSEGEPAWIRQWSNWDYHLERIRNNDEIVDADKDRILSGFQALRQFMGESWLSEIAQSSHPLYHRLSNLVPWSQLSVSRVGHQLENLKSVPKFERLLKRLMSKQEYLSAEAELEVAACFLQGRFHVEFYPSVGSREADLCIEAGGDKFYVEITVVGESQDAQRSSQTLNDLTWPFFPEHRYIAMSGRIYKSLSAPHIRELKNRIAAAIQETKDRHESQELIEPGVMELFISPRDKADELKSWQQQKRISGLQGPPIEVDEVRRIRNKLEQKNRQLPTNEPGLIIVYAHALISQFFEQNFHKSLVNQLQETVYEHENLILGAIIAYGSGSSTAATEKRDDYVLGHRQLYTPLMQEDVLLIRNKYSKFPINEAVMNALLYSTT